MPLNNWQNQTMHPLMLQSLENVSHRCCVIRKVIILNNFVILWFISASGELTEYASYDSKLSINDFDLLKVGEFSLEIEFYFA